MAKAMHYCAKYFSHPDDDQDKGGYHMAGKVRNIFNGEQYQKMQCTPIVLKGKHNVTLGLSTDGFCPFKKRKLTTWPIIILFNFPPEIHIHLDNIICIGTVPGPKAPKEMDILSCH